MEHWFCHLPKTKWDPEVYEQLRLQHHLEATTGRTARCVSGQTTLRDNFHQYYLEHQRCPRRDDPARPACAVAHIAGDGQASSLPLAHAKKPYKKTLETEEVVVCPSDTMYVLREKTAIRHQYGSDHTLTLQNQVHRRGREVSGWV